MTCCFSRQWPTLASMQGKILFVVISTYALQYLAQASAVTQASPVKSEPLSALGTVPSCS